MIHLVHGQALLDVGGEVANGALERTVSAMILHVTIEIPLVLQHEIENEFRDDGDASAQYSPAF